MAVDVQKVVKECEVCKITKSANKNDRPPMGEQRVTEWAGQRLCIDFMGPYPRTKAGNSVIFVWPDNFSKFVWLQPMRHAVAAEVIKFLETKMFHQYGVPEFIDSDNGKQLASQIFGELITLCGIRHVKTGLFSTQANAAERVKQSVLQSPTTSHRVRTSLFFLIVDLRNLCSAYLTPPPSAHTSAKTDEKTRAIMGPEPPNLQGNRFAVLGESPKSKKKRPYQKLTEEFPELPTPVQKNPKFIIVKTKDSQKPISHYSCFAVHKALQTISKEIISISTLRDGNLLMLVTTKPVADYTYLAYVTSNSITTNLLTL